MTTHDDDTDPTGMRALLRGLPDPGPMPADLVTRIHASLAELSEGMDAGSPDLPQGAPADTHGSRPTTERATEGVSRGTQASAPHRASWWMRTGPRLAVAAAVLVGGGALVSGPLGLLGSGGDTATTSTESAAGSAGDSASDTPRMATGADEDTGASAARTTRGPVVVRMSGRSYTAAGLRTEAGGVAAATPTAPLTAESPAIGPIGTEIGVRSCLQALGLPQDSAADVDLAPVDGTPAAVVVVTVDGERTAYAVRRECTAGNPALIAGPVTLP